MDGGWYGREPGQSWMSTGGHLPASDMLPSPPVFCSLGFILESARLCISSSLVSLAASQLLSPPSQGPSCSVHRWFISLISASPGLLHPSTLPLASSMLRGPVAVSF